jgi:hypothetical protein
VWALKILNFGEGLDDFWPGF